MHQTHRQTRLVAPALASLSCGWPAPGPSIRIGTRQHVFGMVADAVAAGLAAPCRVSLARNRRRLELEVADRPEWEAWRTHLGCTDIAVRVYDAEGRIRRSSVARAVRDGCRITVELVEDIDTQAVRMSVWEPEGSL